MVEVLKKLNLANGLCLTFTDQTNRYFGDFHRVCIQFCAEIPLERLALSTEQKNAVSALPDPLRHTKALERMGVTSADLEQVKKSMIEDFLASSLGYLEKESFPQQLLKRKLTEKPQQSVLLRRLRS